ncbi:hypothetical protein FVEN_g6176 [Fusarium venenatum]|uniref:Arrestin-like N-terminal domain-containing protein n=1 Tax=Fusarium venenatum TaxID=56646 RepID=A0A2L2T6S6_9HYPO|nr:uncharacterized protein FVRRES_01921 [Fusarium venenatum]KAG8355997.1 hypothetical protein FVEN_g6176 [Fusarium venenatum]KAH7004939.1 hypothetical protein EDB82DRAFT_551333 [Fusarium venenatum]CEI65409.1 unnamed protein product [Fusarium venenatum]
MPRTGISCSSSLGIRLDGNQRPYAPGDAITGHVYRRNHTINTNASIVISVSGRSKTKIVLQDIDFGDTKRGRFNLISAKTQLKIFQGPIHIGAGADEHVWPFSITLPKYVNPRSLRNDKQRESFLPLHQEDHVLPSTYMYSSDGDIQAFIEYYLTATLKFGGKNKSVEATLPITVMRMPLNPPIPDFGLNRARSHHKIVAYRLVPGTEETKLSFYQELKQILQTSSVPLLAFDLIVSLPTVIQLDNPDLLPVLFHIIPSRTATSKALRDVPQQVELSFISIRVVRTIDLLCSGILSPHSNERSTELDLDVMDTLSKAKGGIYIPCANGSLPVDLRGMIDLRLGRHGRQYFRSPSFTTYNIRQSHSLKWEFRGAIAGQYFKAEGVSPVTLLAPSDERESGRVERDEKAPLANPGAANEPFVGPSQPIRNE